MLIACAAVLMWALPATPQPSPEPTVVGTNAAIVSVPDSLASSKTVESATLGTAAAVLPAKVPAPAVAPVKTWPEPLRAPRAWWALTLTQHGAAAFDAWSTRYSVSAGGRELDPLMRPFVNSSALYPAMQAGPVMLDYVSRRMMRSPRPWMRRMWWVPQAALTTGSVVSGFHNIGVGNRQQH